MPKPMWKISASKATRPHLVSALRCWPKYISRPMSGTLCGFLANSMSDDRFLAQVGFLQALFIFLPSLAEVAAFHYDNPTVSAEKLTDDMTKLFQMFRLDQRSLAQTSANSALDEILAESAGAHHKLAANSNSHAHKHTPVRNMTLTDLMSIVRQSP